MAPLETTGDSAAAYLGAWGEVSRAMESGVSWSGHERNVAFLNCRDGRFVDVSVVAGLDQEADGRVALRCDWDRDGDMDLWLRSRNGPTLRYLENQSNPERFFEFEADRLHARIQLRIDGSDRRPLLEARSSDGYLAAPPRRQVLALEGDAEVSIEWAALGGLPLDTELGAGLTDAGVRQRPKDLAQLAAGALPSSALPTRVVLRTALALPPERLLAIGAPPHAARLIVVKDPACPTCESVLPVALKAFGEGGILGVSTLEIGNPEEAPSVRTVLAVASSLLGPGAELATPLSLLTDASGAVQVLYTGDLDAGIVIQDARWFCSEPVKGAARSTTGTPGRAGRWFHGMPRATTKLTQELRRVGLDPDAAFYAGRRR